MLAGEVQQKVDWMWLVKCISCIWTASCQAKHGVRTYGKRFVTKIIDPTGKLTSAPRKLTSAPCKLTSEAGSCCRQNVFLFFEKNLAFLALGFRGLGLGCRIRKHGSTIQ